MGPTNPTSQTTNQACHATPHPSLMVDRYGIQHTHNIVKIMPDTVLPPMSLKPTKDNSVEGSWQ
jgi:hypothetical protein